MKRGETRFAPAVWLVWWLHKTEFAIRIVGGAALIALGARVAFPLPFGWGAPPAPPVTLQTLAAVLCGFLLGPAVGGLAAAVYLCLALARAPVLAAGKRGPKRVIIYIYVSPLF